MKRFVLAAMLLVCESLYGCEHRPSRPAGAPLAAQGGSAKSGRVVFIQSCAACHGADGSGGPAGPSLIDEHARRPEASVARLIADPAPPMPKLYPGSLTLAQLRDVTAYVESL